MLASEDMIIELPAPAWIVLRWSRDGRGSGDLVSSHSSPAEAQVDRDAAQRNEPSHSFTIEQASREQLAVLLRNRRSQNLRHDCR